MIAETDYHYTSVILIQCHLQFRSAIRDVYFGASLERKYLCNRLRSNCIIRGVSNTKKRNICMNDLSTKSHRARDINSSKYNRTPRKKHGVTLNYRLAKSYNMKQRLIFIVIVNIICSNHIIRKYFYWIAPSKYSTTVLIVWINWVIWKIISEKKERNHHCGAKLNFKNTCEPHPK